MAGTTAAAAGTAASLNHPLAAGFLDLLREGYAISVWAKTNDIKNIKKTATTKGINKSIQGTKPTSLEANIWGKSPPKTSNLLIQQQIYNHFCMFFFLHAHVFLIGKCNAKRNDQ